MLNSIRNRSIRAMGMIRNVTTSSARVLSSNLNVLFFRVIGASLRPVSSLANLLRRNIRRAGNTNANANANAKNAFQKYSRPEERKNSSTSQASASTAFKTSLANARHDPEKSIPTALLKESYVPSLGQQNNQEINKTNAPNTRPDKRPTVPSTPKKHATSTKNKNSSPSQEIAPTTPKDITTKSSLNVDPKETSANDIEQQAQDSKETKTTNAQPNEQPSVQKEIAIPNETKTTNTQSNEQPSVQKETKTNESLPIDQKPISTSESDKTEKVANPVHELKNSSKIALRSLSTITAKSLALMAYRNNNQTDSIPSNGSDLWLSLLREYGRISPEMTELNPDYLEIPSVYEEALASVQSEKVKVSNEDEAKATKKEIGERLPQLTRHMAALEGFIIVQAKKYTTAEERQMPPIILNQTLNKMMDSKFDLGIVSGGPSEQSLIRLAMFSVAMKGIKD